MPYTRTEDGLRDLSALSPELEELRSQRSNLSDEQVSDDLKEARRLLEGVCSELLNRGPSGSSYVVQHVIDDLADLEKVAARLAR